MLNDAEKGMKNRVIGLYHEDRSRATDLSCVWLQRFENSESKKIEKKALGHEAVMCPFRSASIGQMRCVS